MRSAWYQALLSNHQESVTEPGSLTFNFGVGTSLDYFFDF
jgi:hypothetical protein